MLYHLFEWFKQEGIKFPGSALFTFITFRVLLAMLLALVISPLVAALLLVALPNLRTERQWRASIQAVIGWCRSRNSKGASRMSAFAVGTADRIDYWIRRRVLQYWDGVHPSQGLLNSGRDRRVELSAIRHDRHREGIDAP